MGKRIFKTLVLITLLLATASYAKLYDRKVNERAIQRELKKMDKGIAQGPFKAAAGGSPNTEWSSIPDSISQGRPI